jgi:hypothetical protein
MFSQLQLFVRVDCFNPLFERRGSPLQVDEETTKKLLHLSPHYLRINRRKTWEVCASAAAAMPSRRLKSS